MIDQKKKDVPWFKHTILYSLDVATFLDSNDDGIGDFKGLTLSLNYLADLGIDCIWLLPFYPSPLKDDGYDISNYLAIDPRLGTMDDFKEFITKAKELNIKIVNDLVFNHTSDQHPWFQEARRNKFSKYRDYYIWTEKKPENERWQVAFKGEQKDIWTYDEVAREYYLHRFYKQEPDLNIANPEVKNEFREIIHFWLNQGVSGFRIDVAQILIDLEQPTAKKKRDYTLLNLIHNAAFEHGQVMLLAEANDIASKLMMYFGHGDRMNLLFNFILNQHLFLALAQQQAKPIEDEVRRLPLQPDYGQWLNYIRNHDDLSLDKLSDQEREIVYKAFAPEKDMQIYGNAIRRRPAPMFRNDRRLIELAFSLIFSLPGIPMVRYGDEIGMGEDLSLKGRESVRTVMQWNDQKNGGFSRADKKDLIMPTIDQGTFSYYNINVQQQENETGSLLNWIKKLIRIRKQYRIIGEGKFQIISSNQPKLLIHKISNNESQFFAFHNLSDQEINFTTEKEITEGEVVFSDDKKERNFNKLSAYGYRWIQVKNE